MRTRGDDPAFPLPNGNDNVHPSCAGMTIRGYFAGSVDVSVYSPYETLREKLKRKPTVKELADYVVALRKLEADLLIEALEINNDAVGQEENQQAGG